MSSILHIKPVRGATGAVVAGLTLALYGTTLSRAYTGDSIEFAMAIESGRLAEVVESHQLLVHPLGWGFYRLWQWAGWEGRALLPLQVLNALCGALCAGIMCRIAARLTGSERMGLLVGAGFALSFGAWMLSTDAEFATPPLTLALLVLWAVLASSAGTSARPLHAVILGVGAALATLAYLTNAALVPVGVVGYLMASELRAGAGRRQAIVYALTAVGVFAVAYLSALYAVFDVRDWQSLIGWEIRVGTGTSYGVLRWQNVPHGVYAFLRSLAGFAGLGLNDRTGVYFEGASQAQRLAFSAYYCVVLAAAALPLALAAVRRRRLLSVHGRSLGVLATWAILYAAFALYWVPGDLSFWLPVLVPWWILVGLLLAGTNGSTDRRGWAGYGVALAVAALIALTHGAGVVLPRRDIARNGDYQVAVSVAERTKSADLVVTRPDSRLLNYVPYFARRRAVAIPELRPEDPVLAGQVEAALAREVTGVWSAGGRVFAVGVPPAGEWPWRARARSGDSTPSRGDYMLAPAWVVDGQPVLEVVSR